MEQQKLTTAQQFAIYGCASRCIIQLLNFLSRPIAEVDFVEKFRPKFEKAWADRCGLLVTSGIIDVCRELDIGKHAQTLRHLDKVRFFLQHGMFEGIFAITEMALSDPYRPVAHCSLIKDYRDGFWEVWTPLDDGTGKTLQVTSEFLESRIPHFIVIFG